MKRAPLPPGARDILTKRERSFLLNDVFIACGWPSQRLKRHVTPPRCSEAYPSLYDSAHAIGTPESAARYQWRFVVGLSVILWAESSVQASILTQEVAPLILAAHPLLLQLWRMYPGNHDVVDFIKLSSNREVRHAA